MQRFNICDLNAIETRVAAWLAGCEDLMRVFTPLPGKPNGRCPYLDFATKLYGIPNDILEKEYLSKDYAIKGPVKRKRQIAKAGVLQCIYRAGGGGWGYSKKGYKDHSDGCQDRKKCDCPTIYDKIKTGLWGFLWNMGVEVTQEQAHETVRIFREYCKNAVEFWYKLEENVADVLNASDTKRYLGPDKCIQIDKINIDGRLPMMRMRLPSGRFLHYLDARLESCKMPWKDRDGKDVYRDSLVYAGTNQETKQWDIWVQTHGGKLFENLVQGIARDVLAVKLLQFEEADMPVVGHVHDEGICLVPDDDFSPTIEDQIRIMSQPIDWAPGLLLGADGFESSFYRK